MFTVEDFVSKFESYTDVQLMEIYSNPSGYSAEAQQALAKVVATKGGIDKLAQRIADQQAVLNERNRINNVVAQALKDGTGAGLLKGVYSSDLLDANEIDAIIDFQAVEFEKAKKDESITQRTIIGSLFGVLISGTVGGILWGVLMIYSQRVFFLFFAALVCFCYWIIKLFTKQSRRNIVVIIATIIAALIVGVLGELIFELFGPIERPGI